MREFTYTELHALHGAVTLALAEIITAMSGEQRLHALRSVARIDPLMRRTVDENIDAVETFIALLDLFEKEVFARPEAQGGST